MNDWQPIETAPLDVDVLLRWDDGAIRIGSRYAPQILHWFKCTLDLGDGYASLYVPQDYIPTHWHPIPTLALGEVK